MAVFAPIPLPKPGEGLAEGTDWMNKLLMAPIERREKEAKALEASMKSEFLRKIFGLGGEGGLQGSDQASSGLSGISPSEVARSILGLSPQSPEEKEASELRVAKKREQAGSDIKAGEELEDVGSDITKTLAQIRRAKEIFKRRPDLTGKLAGGLAKMGFSTDPDINALVNIFGDLQTAKARAAGRQGGAQLMSQVKEIKPDISKQGAANIAMLDDMEKDWMTAHGMVKNRYKRKTGQELGTALGTADNEVSPTNVTNWTIKDGQLVKE